MHLLLGRVWKAQLKQFKGGWTSYFFFSNMKEYLPGIILPTSENSMWHRGDRSASPSASTGTCSSMTWSLFLEKLGESGMNDYTSGSYRLILLLVLGNPSPPAYRHIQVSKPPPPSQLGGRNYALPSGGGGVRGLGSVGQCRRCVR